MKLAKIWELPTTIGFEIREIRVQRMPYRCLVDCKDLSLAMYTPPTRHTCMQRTNFIIIIAVMGFTSSRSEISFPSLCRVPLNGVAACWRVSSLLDNNNHGQKRKEKAYHYIMLSL